MIKREPDLFIYFWY